MLKFTQIKWSVGGKATTWAIVREGKRMGLIVRSPVGEYEIHLPGKKLSAHTLACAQSETMKALSA